MLEPQSTALFVLLLALFGVLMWRMLATRRVALRVLAACLAFVPAMVFGVLAVNKYYGYYQTWGAMIADFTQQDTSAASGPPDIKLTAGSRSGTTRTTPPGRPRSRPGRSSATRPDRRTSSASSPAGPCCSPCWTRRSRPS